MTESERLPPVQDAAPVAGERVRREPAQARPGGVSRRPPAGSAAQLLRLQRSAGNRAVTSLLAGPGAGPKLMRTKYQKGDKLGPTTVPGLQIDGRSWCGGTVQAADEPGDSAERYEILDDEGATWHLHLPLLGDEERSGQSLRSRHEPSTSAAEPASAGAGPLKEPKERHEKVRESPLEAITREGEELAIPAKPVEATATPRQPSLRPRVAGAPNRKQPTRGMKPTVTLVASPAPEAQRPVARLATGSAPFRVADVKLVFPRPASTAVASKDQARAEHKVKVGPMMHFQLTEMRVSATVTATENAPDWQVGWAQTTVRDFARYGYPSCRYGYESNERLIDTVSNSSAPFASTAATVTAPPPEQPCPLGFGDAPGDWIPVVDPKGGDNAKLRLQSAELQQRFDLYLLALNTKTGDVVILATAGWQAGLEAAVHHAPDGSTLAKISNAAGKDVGPTKEPPTLGGSSALDVAHSRFKFI